MYPVQLSKIYHAAFDAHQIGINTNYRIRVSDSLLVRRDGSRLEALKRLRGGKLLRLVRQRDLPDRDRLAQRFERFMATGP